MRNQMLQWSAATLLFWLSASHSAYAACELWLLEPFTLTQSNGFTVEVSITGNYPGNITGWADYYRSRSERWVRGELANGQLLGNHLHFLVKWKNGTNGIYDADIDGSGRIINGKTYDRERPTSKATWTTTVTLKCCVPQPGHPCR